MHAELMLLWPLVVQPFLRAPTWVQKLSTLLYSYELTPLSPPLPHICRSAQPCLHLEGRSDP